MREIKFRAWLKEDKKMVNVGTLFEGKQLRSTSYAGLKSWAKDTEILGNIYENPELLEENKW